MSTIQVDRIQPYQSASVTIDGFSAPNLATTGSNTFVGNQIIQGTITASIQEGFALVGGVGNVSTLVATSSFGGALPSGVVSGSSQIDYPQISNIPSDIVSGSSQLTASYDQRYALSGSGGSVVGVATTGSNTFVGDQTLIDASGNTVTLSDASGSLMLVAKTFTSASAHLTASVSNQVNLIFKNNNNTTDTTISGSNNIFTNPSAPIADYKRIIGSNNIVNSATGIPQVTGSMTTPITMASNYFGSGTTTIRGPITGSGYTISNNSVVGTLNIGQPAVNDMTRVSTLSLTGNQVIGTMTIAATTSATLPNIASTATVTNNIVNGAMQATMNSSSLAFSNNIVNAGSLIIANNHFTTAAGTGQLSVSSNIIGGSQISNLNVIGSNQGGTTNNPAFNGNIMYGISNAAHINADNARTSGTNAYTSLLSTAILGSNLAVTGSSLGSDTTTVGSAFVGRFNANDGIRNKTSEIVFAVGTGTATGTRKTGLLVDSGSNTFVEGSLNVSGSSSFTGSVNVSGSVKQTFNAPTTDTDIPLITVNNAVVTGTPFNNVRMIVQDYPGIGQAYGDSFAIEYYDSLSYLYGSEFTLNGKEINFLLAPTGSAVNGQFRLLDNGASKCITDWNAAEMYIGTSLSRSTDFIRMGNTGMDYIRLTSLKNEITGSTEITGSVSLSSTLQLAGQDPLPAGAVGQLAVSGSNLYYHNGSTWSQIN